MELDCDEKDRLPIKFGNPLFNEGYIEASHSIYFYAGRKTGPYFEIFISNTSNTKKGICRKVYTTTNQSFLEEQKNSPIIPFQIRLNCDKEDDGLSIITYPSGVWWVYDYTKNWDDIQNNIYDFEGRIKIYYDGVINTYIVGIPRRYKEEDIDIVFQIHDYLRQCGKEYTTIIFTHKPKSFIRSETPTIINSEYINLCTIEKLDSIKLNKKWELLLADPNPTPVFSEEYSKKCEAIKNWVDGCCMLGHFWFFDRCSDTVIYTPYFSSKYGKIIYDKENLFNIITKSTTLHLIKNKYDAMMLIDGVRVFYDSGRHAIVLAVGSTHFKLDLLKIIDKIINFSINPINILITDTPTADIRSRVMEIDTSKIKHGFNDGSGMRKYEYI